MLPILSCTSVEHRLLALSEHVENCYLLLFQETYNCSLLRKVLNVSVSEVYDSLTIELAVICHNRISDLLPKLLIHVAGSSNILSNTSERGELNVNLLVL